MNSVINGIMGLCVGDALGVPVEFKKRDELKRKPVENMLWGMEPITNRQGPGPTIPA